jgi:hypothetical protein
MSFHYFTLILKSKPLEHIRARWNKATKELEGSMNYPFSGSIKKPRPSLSKHDHKHPDQHWHVDDVNFLCGAYQDIGLLLEATGIAVPLIKEMLDTISRLECRDNTLVVPTKDVGAFLRWSNEGEKFLKLLELPNDILDKEE